MAEYTQSFSDFTKRYYLPARPYGYALFRLYFRLHAYGVEHIPSDGPVILVPNHTSFLDPPLLSAVVPRVIYYLMLHHHFYHPLFHWLFKRLPCIPMKRSVTGASAMKLTLQVLENNQIVCVFPEGGISREHKSRGLRQGAALLALKTGAPIVPAALVGASDALPLEAKLPRPRRIAIHFGKPLYVPQEDPRDKVFLQNVMEDTMSRIHELIAADRHCQ